MTMAAGTKLGRYEIRSKIGAGGPIFSMPVHSDFSATSGSTRVARRAGM
jgi:hypothetical protein